MSAEPASQCRLPLLSLFFFNDTATTEIYTLSLHDALPICTDWHRDIFREMEQLQAACNCSRTEEHTSELQSPDHLVCRLLLEKKKKIKLRHVHAVHAEHIAHGLSPG